MVTQDQVQLVQKFLVRVRRTLVRAVTPCQEVRALERSRNQLPIHAPLAIRVRAQRAREF